MTRKDYTAISRLIANHLPIHAPLDDSHLGSTRFINRLADYLADDNPRFDREKFIAACTLR